MTPIDEDYVLSPCGHLGGKIAVSQCHHRLGEFVEMDDALAFVRDHMETEQYWLAIWWCSDHGNMWPIDAYGNEITLDEEDADEYIDHLSDCDDDCNYCGHQ